jgi:hypothetical protein
MRSIPSDKIKGVQIDRPAPVKVKPIEPVKATPDLPKDDGKVLHTIDRLLKCGWTICEQFPIKTMKTKDVF